MKEARVALAQAMRMERLGDTRFAWESLDRSAQEDWCRRADHLLRLLAADGYAITRAGDAKPTPSPPAASDIYAIVCHAPESERIIRKDGDGWQLVGHDRRDGAEKVLLVMTMAETDIDADAVLSGAPDAQKLKAIGTRLAMSTLIRKLHGEAA